MRRFKVITEDKGVFAETVIPAKSAGQAESQVAGKRGGKPPAQVIEVQEVLRDEARTKVPVRARLALWRGLASQLRAGLKANRAMELAHKAAVGKKTKVTIQAASREMAQGKPLSAVLGEFPNLAAPSLVSMMAAGEKAGTTAVAAQSSYEMLNDDYQTQRAVKNALIYPAIVLVVAVAVVTLLMWTAVPTLASIFDELGTALPWITRMLVNLSHAIRDHPVMVVLFLAAMIGAFKWLVPVLKAPFLVRGKPLLHEIVMKIPGVGSLLLMANEARVVQTLYMLTKSSLPLADALRLCRPISWLLPINAAIAQIEHDFGQKGENIDVAFARHPKIFSPAFVAVLNTGRLSGAFANALEQYYPEAKGLVDDRVNILKEIMVPALIVLVAIMVGGIVFAFFLPLFDLVQAVSK